MSKRPTLRSFRFRDDLHESLPELATRYGLSMTKFIAASIAFALRHPDFRGHAELHPIKKIEVET